jgi:hypothetical protein
MTFREAYDSWYKTTMRLLGQPLCIDELTREANNILFIQKDKGSNGREVRFERTIEVPNSLRYIASFIPELNQIPSTAEFDLKVLSEKTDNLKNDLDKIISDDNFPDTIRIIRSHDKGAYAIFVNAYVTKPL